MKTLNDKNRTPTLAEPKVSNPRNPDPSPRPVPNAEAVTALCEPPPAQTRRDERRRLALWVRLVRPARSGARVPLVAECLLAGLGACVERRRALGPLLRRVRRERLARRGPPGGWPDPVTERACVWLARDERVYAALLEEAGNAVLARGHVRDDDGAGGETAAQRIAEFLRVSVACWLRSSPDAARFIGSAALTEVDWPRVAEWFLRHRVHPADCRHG